MTDTIPFVDSENHQDLLKKSGDFKYSDISTKLNEDGYCIVDLEIEDKLIDRVNKDVEKEIVKKPELTANEKYAVKMLKSGYKIKSIMLQTKLTKQRIKELRKENL